ncbi:DUF4347 domain-containing protein [Siculibacillus lacustris]|nr:DUF4347 domain-containing protein [Siculibacillus lacustris]
MFDGAAAVDAVHAATGAHDVAAALAPAPVEVRAADPSRDGGKKEVAFVDTGLSNWQALVSSLEASKPGMAIELIEADRSGLAQMAAWAATNSGFDAIHIVSGGSSGTITVGSDRVTDTTLADATVATELGGIGAALKPGGEVLLYGSRVGADTAGATFVADLAGRLGSAVAASDHVVGDATKGGDWSLSVTVGTSTVRPVALTGYLGTLGTGDTADRGTPAPVEVQAADVTLDGGRLEVTFIDTSVSGWQSLVRETQSTRPGMEIELIDGSVGGLKQIATWATSHTGYDAIHILSHGSEAELLIGTDTITEASLSDAATRADLAAIGASLKTGGDLLLYGCDVAAGSDGAQFVTDLSAAVGRTTAASTDDTGSAAQGGDWQLEFATAALGSVPLLDLVGYDGKLATFSTPSGTFTIQTNGAYAFNSGNDQIAGLPDKSLAIVLTKYITATSIYDRYIKEYNTDGSLKFSVHLNAIVTLNKSNWVSIHALANGNLVVAYGCSDSGDPGSKSAFFVVLNSSGSIVTSATQINTLTGSSLTRYMQIAQLSNGNIAFAYQRADNQSIATRVFTTAGVAVTSEIAIATSTNDLTQAIAASSNGGYLVLYTNGTATGGALVYNNS